MQLLNSIKSRVAQWPYGLLSVMAGLSAFGAYTCMYAFRKAFAAGTFTGHQYLHVDYKAWLVIAQVLGYMLSKFYGIRFIAEVKPKSRGKSILLLIGISWLALLLFALIPAPYNIVCLFINGFPLGMIWGLVFGYLEGRKSTELMAAVLSISLIFASGFVKTVARNIMGNWHVSEYVMPFVTGAAFVAPLLLFVFFLEVMPPPTRQDKQLRTERIAMNSAERRAFISRFLPGIILTVIVYLLLTIMRDIRDNFEVEIWHALGVKNNGIFVSIDSVISIAVLAGIGLLILIRNNIKAFTVIHIFIICGCLLAGVATVLFNLGSVGPVWWMTMAGLGLYAGYVPYNAIFFERMIASFNYKSNVGFIMYVADAIGYLGSISVLLLKELANPRVSWDLFFKNGLIILSVVGTISGVLSLVYFLQSARKSADKKRQLTLFTA
ncbi:hypothetical protein GWR56_03440 [Mucilaginibacter sp. 14171R-50]|uniref:DUF5690 family protein n=1 Tax=Mucilaginibacter sp. 14171R-50 TaxID=2703789 RepID=UPI00138B28A4|nr:DUF5690 family protein [Mucilaginibacter sp. 14171R-50]QHS54643.1 hypothetical protein GWR56_03440 [Mucilaginibacter sp. 14171R-50]